LRPLSLPFPRRPADQLWTYSDYRPIASPCRARNVLSLCEPQGKEPSWPLLLSLLTGQQSHSRAQCHRVVHRLQACQPSGETKRSSTGEPTIEQIALEFPAHLTA